MSVDAFAQPERLKVLLERYRTPLNEGTTERPIVLPLLLTHDDLALFERMLPILRREWGTDDLSVIVVRAIAEAAERT